MSDFNESKTKHLIYSISKEQLSAKQERADRVLARIEGMPSRSQLRRWFDAGKILMQGRVLSADSMLKEGDEIQVTPIQKEVQSIEARPFELDIYFEDDHLMVLRKPKGLSMHPGASFGNPTTLVHALLAHQSEWSKQAGGFRPGIVHRLDKDTEGLVVVAKNDHVHAHLAKQFESRTVDRAYWALCHGHLKGEKIIETGFGRDPRNRKKMSVSSTSARRAKTLVKSLGLFEDNYSWVECRLFTGRTHQIRVHLSHIKHPILGDALYARKRVFKNSRLSLAYESLQGQALCAFRLGFEHPVTQKQMNFSMKEPEWLTPFIRL